MADTEILFVYMSSIFFFMKSLKSWWSFRWRRASFDRLVVYRYGILIKCIKWRICHKERWDVFIQELMFLNLWSRYALLLFLSEVSAGGTGVCCRIRSRFLLFFLNWSFVMKLTTKKSSGTLPRNVPEGTGTGTNNKKKFVQVLGHKTIQSAGQERFRMLLSDGK